MPTLKPSEGSYHDTPLRVPVLPRGIYDFMVQRAELKQSNAGDSTNLVLSLQVVTDGQYRGRPHTHYISTSKPDPKVADVRIKRLFSACGVKPNAEGGFELDELKEKLCRGLVENRVSQDAQGVDRENANIVDFWVPGEPELVLRPA